MAACVPEWPLGASADAASGESAPPERGMDSNPAARQSRAEAWLRRGIDLLGQNDPRSARAALDQCVLLAPHSPDARCHLAVALTRCGDKARAEAEAREALALAPGHARAAHLLGALLCERDAIEEGATWLSRAAAAMPDNALAQRDYGAVQLFLGRPDQAREALLRAIELDPGSPEALFNVVRLVDFARGGEDARRIEVVVRGLQLDEARLSSNRRVELAYAVGKILQDQGKWDDAFAAYAHGANLKRALVDWDAAGTQARFSRIESLFDRALLEMLCGHGARGRRPVFIFGLPRSGTTLVEQILGSHPLVQTAGETTALLETVARTNGPGGEVWPEWVGFLQAGDCAGIGQAYMSRLPAPEPGKACITDKRLENFEHAGLISLVLEDAVMISCRRNPGDAGLGAFTMLFSEEQHFSYSLDEIGRYWRGWDRLVDHWRTVLPPDRLLEVDYESLVADPETVSRRIIAHAGLPWDDVVLEFHHKARPVRSASAVQVRQPLHRGSVGRWRRFERHLGPMFDAMGIDPASLP